MQTLRDKEVKEERPRRGSTADGSRNVLVPRTKLDEENFVYRWVNDHGDNLPMMWDLGYGFVSNQGKIDLDVTVNDGKQDAAVYSKRVGGGITAYLMACPKDIWEKRQKLHDMEVDALEQSIKVQTKAQHNYGNIDVEQRKR